MTVRTFRAPRAHATAASAGTEAAGRPAVVPVSTRGSQRGIDPPPPAGLPPLTGCDWPRVIGALAGTDDEELPLFGRFPAWRRNGHHVFALNPRGPSSAPCSSRP